MATIKKHTRGTVQQRTHVRTAHQQSKEENYEPITAAEKQSITVYAWAVELFSWWRLVVYSRNVVIYIIFILSYILVVRWRDNFFFSIITINIDLFFFGAKIALCYETKLRLEGPKKIYWDRPPPPYRRAWMTAPPPLSESLNPPLLYTCCCTCAPLVLDSDRHCPLDWAILLVHKEKELSPSIAINFLKKIDVYFRKSLWLLNLISGTRIYIFILCKFVFMFLDFKF